MEEKYKKIIGQVVHLIDDNLIDENGSEFETMQRYLEQDLTDIIALRDKIYGHPDFYDEDYILLDHTLDSLETLIGIIRIIRSDK